MIQKWVVASFWHAFVLDSRITISKDSFYFNIENRYLDIFRNIIINLHYRQVCYYIIYGIYLFVFAH